MERHASLWPPRKAAEWGSGGIFGLRRCGNTIYFTLAFEGEAHFYSEDGKLIYRFEQIGPGPVSGGDTYNASDCDGEKIYFGGWVHAPSVIKEGSNGRELDFRNKYSHVHEYDIEKGEVKLLWAESIRHENRWTGEVSEIIYNPIGSSLLIARGDGHENLGVYELVDRKMIRLSDAPALKGSIFLDYACFDVLGDWLSGVVGVQCFSLSRNKVEFLRIDDWAKISIDGAGVDRRGSGYAIGAFTRYYHFMRGGVLVGNPVDPRAEELKFVRLFDFGDPQPSPQRANAVPAGGGILAPFSSLVHGAIYADGVAPQELREMRGPSVLVYISPPQARIVGAYGARITSIAKSGSKIMIAYNTAPNLGGRDAMPIDIGYRGIMVAEEEELLTRGGPPVTFRVRGRALDGRFGGIPLAGYRRKRLIVIRGSSLRVIEYDIGTPPLTMSEERYSLSSEREVIDLDGYGGIVSFELTRKGDSSVYVELS